MNKQRKVGIIGLGHVAAHVAYTLCVRAIADELVLVDVNDKKIVFPETILGQAKIIPEEMGY